MIKSNIIKHTDHLQAEIRDNIGLIAFNRPESKNALSDELTPALRTTLENFESDKNVRVILITGNGGAFCSGGDVKSFANNSDPGLSSDLSVEQKVRNPNTLKFISQCKTWIINRDMPSNVPQSFQKLTEAMDKQRSTKLTELDSRFKEYL